jgi:outer membrane protein OmpA-like peptidoglycan-associated protein
MSGRVAQLTASWLVGGLAVVCASCTHPRAATVEQPTQAVPRPSAPLRVAQFAFGREAYFAACAEPACPRVTPKTLGGTPALSQAVGGRGVDSTPAQAPAPLARPAQELAATQPPRHAIARTPTTPDGAVTPAQSVVVQAVPAAPVLVATVLAPGSSAPPIPRADESAAAPSAPMSRDVAVTFAFGQAALRPEARAVLLSSLELARNSERIVISGRTDAIGDAKANDALALARALAVSNFIRDHAPGLKATIVVEAKGGCCFVASNRDREGRARNRRVEVVFDVHGAAS